MRTVAQKQHRPACFVSSSRAEPRLIRPAHGEHPVLRLQRAIGNQAVQRLLQVQAEVVSTDKGGSAPARTAHDGSGMPSSPSAASGLQRKLAISAPGDALEQEADRAAEDVMRTSRPRLQPPCGCGGACCGGEPERSDQGRARLQTRRARSGDLGPSEVPPIVDEVTASSGRSLDAAARAIMEPQFGHDFSRVRVHTDLRAAESARAVNALAYTVGRDIVFGAGQYAPGTAAGNRLLAHELAHVLQQTGVTPALSRLRESSPESTAQPESPGATARAARREPASVRLSVAPRSIQRQLCGGQRLPPCPTSYISIPSNSGIGNIVGEWIGLRYLAGHPVRSYLLVDHRLYFRGGRGTMADLSQRTSRTGTPRPGIDPFVYTALQTSEFFDVSRPDILDSDRDHLYEIKPIRGAGAGPAQLNDYVRRLNQFATTAPDWMGSRARNWQAGPWRPRLQQRFSVGAQPVIVCVYPDTTPGVLLYDILTCPRVPPVPVRVPERVPVWSTVPVRIADAHPAFRVYAAQVPELRPTLPGREILVLLEAGLFGYALEEARRRQIEQITRPMRVDPRGIPLFQVQPVLIGGAFFAGIIVVPVLIAVLVVAIVALAYALATAIVAAASAVAEAAATATAGAALRWSVATFGRAAAATVAARIAAEGTMSQAEAAEALRPLIGKPIVAMGDVTARPDLANVQLGQKVSVGGQPFRSIIRLTSREG